MLAGASSSGGIRLPSAFPSIPSLSSSSSSAASPITPAAALRVGGSGSEPKYREKFVVMLERILVLGHDTATLEPEFWHELFLLKTNTKWLYTTFESLSETEILMTLKKPLNALFAACLQTLLHDFEQPFRQENALLLLCALFRSLCSKQWNNFSLDVLTLSSGFERADSYFRDLISVCKRLVFPPASLSRPDEQQQQRHDRIVNRVTSLLCVLTCGFDLVNQNALLEYLMAPEVFDICLHAISHYPKSELIRRKGCIALTVLINFQKIDFSKNGHLRKLSVLQADPMLYNFADCIDLCFLKWNKAFEAHRVEQASTVKWIVDSLWNSSISIVSSAVGMFKSFTSSAASSSSSQPEPPSSPPATPPSPYPSSSLLSASDPTVVVRPSKRLDLINAELLIFYELVRSNRDFVACLTRSLAVQAAEAIQQKGDEQSEVPRQSSVKMRAVPFVLESFFTMASIILQESKSTSNIHYSRICLSLLMTLVQLPECAPFLHDPHVLIGPNRILYRKEKESEWTPISTHPQPQGAAAAAAGAVGPPPAAEMPIKTVLELLLLFMSHNLKRNLQVDLYVKCFDILITLLLYERQHHLKVDFAWRSVWNQVIKVLDRIAAGGIDVPSNADSSAALYALISHGLMVLNLSIVCGNLPSASHLDALYYEIIRQRSTFANLTTWISRVVDGSSSSAGGGEMASQIAPINGIISHFSSCLTSRFGSAMDGHSNPTMAQVLDVIQRGYEDLELTMDPKKLIASAGQLTMHYSENSSAFQSSLLRGFVQEARTAVIAPDLEQ